MHRKAGQHRQHLAVVAVAGQRGNQTLACQFGFAFLDIQSRQLCERRCVSLVAQEGILKGLARARKVVEHLQSLAPKLRASRVLRSLLLELGNGNARFLGLFAGQPGADNAEVRLRRRAGLGYLLQFAQRALDFRLPAHPCGSERCADARIGRLLLGSPIEQRIRAGGITLQQFGLRSHHQHARRDACALQQG